VETITGALFLCGFFAFGLSPQLPLALGFMAVLVPITFIDLDHHIIPDRIVLPAAGVGLAYSMLLDPSRWWQYIISGLGAALFLFVIALLWAGGMGMGDVKLALLLGFVLGPQVVVGLFAAFLFGGVVGMALLASRRKTRKDRVAFGPFLSGGAVLSLFVGSLVTEWYLGLF
jgi:leader peptidase (prepilin peptidase)/N-methyltransferase